MEIGDKFTTQSRIDYIKTLDIKESEKLLPIEEKKVIISELDYLNADLLANIARSLSKLSIKLK